MAVPVPLLLSHKIRALPEGKVWLGGGEVDLKMRVEVAELAAAHDQVVCREGE